MQNNFSTNKKNIKSQTAIEYLVTYGWAILIIVIVISIFIYSSFFSNASNKIYVIPGECSVYRPTVSTGILQPSMKGLCNNAPPEYVAQFIGQGFISSLIPIIPEGTNSITFTMWFNGANTAMSNPPYADPNLLSYGAESSCNPGQPADIYINNHQVNINWWCGGISIPMTVQNNTWYFIAYSWNGLVASGFGGFGNLFINSTASEINSISASGIAIGTYGGAQTGNGPFVGYISNLQIYNSSLSPSEIQVLYQEGIGGAPINLNHLIAWYPLDGNPYDYSGYGNNGTAINVIFVSNWQSGYTAP
jgi:hypothetical protein